MSVSLVVLFCAYRLSFFFTIFLFLKQKTAYELRMSDWSSDVCSSYLVGREPSGNPFNSIVQLEYERGKPRNPFINAGALALADVILSGHRPREALGDILHFIRHVAEDRKSVV